MDTESVFLNLIFFMLSLVFWLKPNVKSCFVYYAKCFRFHFFGASKNLPLISIFDLISLIFYKILIKASMLINVNTDICPRCSLLREFVNFWVEILLQTWASNEMPPTVLIQIRAISLVSEVLMMINAPDESLLDQFCNIFTLLLAELIN